MKNKIIIVFVSWFAIVIVFSIPSTTTYERPQDVPAPIIKELEAPIEPKPQVPPLYPTLKRICSCESTGRPDNEPQQFNADGSVIRGKINPLDTGMCQINKYYHEESAEKMGLDLETEYGNAVYANWLFDTQGATPWEWSRSCWGS
jgi:hypothetical protein